MYVLPFFSIIKNIFISFWDIEKLTRSVCTLIKYCFWQNNIQYNLFVRRIFSCFIREKFFCSACVKKNNNRIYNVFLLLLCVNIYTIVIQRERQKKKCFCNQTIQSIWGFLLFWYEYENTFYNFFSRFSQKKNNNDTMAINIICKTCENLCTTECVYLRSSNAINDAIF